MDIKINEIDVYKSTKFKGKVLSEYIVYLMVDDTPVEAYTAFGEELTIVLNTLKDINNIESTYFQKK